MKKIYTFFAFLVIGFSAHTAVADNFRNAYGEAFIFVEGGVEFAIYPDGQFDFYFNHRNTGYSVNVATPHVNFSYNAGYNYDPFVQYDDFGAVIQVEDVPVYYDHFGRIIQAGHVSIAYNHFGSLARVGHLSLHYNRYNHFTHYTGFINRYNPYYVYRPWHRHYTRPQAHFAIVYHQPYRAHYHPERMNYGHYRNYYKGHHKKDFRRSYYRPGDRVASYHRGRRSATPRDLHKSNRYSEPAADRTRSNVISTRERRPYRVESKSRTFSGRAKSQAQPRESTQSQSRDYRKRTVTDNRNDVRTSSREVKPINRRDARRSSTVTSQREPRKNNSRARVVQRVQRGNIEAGTPSSNRNSRSTRGRGN